VDTAVKISLVFMIMIFGLDKTLFVVHAEACEESSGNLLAAKAVREIFSLRFCAVIIEFQLDLHLKCAVSKLN